MLHNVWEHASISAFNAEMNMYMSAWKWKHECGIGLARAYLTYSTSKTLQTPPPATYQFMHLCFDHSFSPLHEPSQDLMYYKHNSSRYLVSESGSLFHFIFQSFIVFPGEAVIFLHFRFVLESKISCSHFSSHARTNAHIFILMLRTNESHLIERLLIFRDLFAVVVAICCCGCYFIIPALKKVRRKTRTHTQLNELLTESYNKVRLWLWLWLWLVGFSFFSFLFFSFFLLFFVRGYGIYYILVCVRIAMSLRFCHFDIDLITFDLNKSWRKKRAHPRSMHDSRSPCLAVRRMRGWKVQYDCHFPLLSNF